MKPSLLHRNENKTLDFFKNYNKSKVKWVHLSCALFVPELGFVDAKTKSPVCGFDKVD